MNTGSIRNPGLAAMLLAGLLVTGCGGGGPSAEMELGGINTGEVLKGLLDRTARTLAGVQDMASARAAAPQLAAINDDFDDLIYHVPNLSAEGRTEMARMAARSLPEIQGAAARINGMRGLDEILGPAMDEMVDKLTQLL
jgi:hypothetical protein